mmetsp:Transcript_30071/g.89361  ORF Transcript_30071/g.89361 Transcript_30071/m.89361 type:complete len:951 (-) Transcript_30071:1405-4257(-)
MARASTRKKKATNFYASDAGVCGWSPPAADVTIKAKARAAASSTSTVGPKGKAAGKASGRGAVKAKAAKKQVASKTKQAKHKTKPTKAKSTASKTKTKRGPKLPTVLVSPSSGSKIPVVTLTLSDIKAFLSSKVDGGTQGDAGASSSKTKLLSQKQQRCLVRVPSRAVRGQLYEEAAKSIAEREGRFLPGHGGRPWRCEVRVSDAAGGGGASGFSGKAYDDGSKGKKSLSSGNAKDKRGGSGAAKSGAKAAAGGGGSGALFRWFRGSLELASPPHIFEKTPPPLDGAAEAVLSPDHRPEYESDSENDEWDSDDDDSEGDDMEPKKTDLCMRECSELSELAWSHPSCHVPVVERRWLSPDMKYFLSRSSALAHAKELIRRDKLVDRVLHGLGERGTRLRPNKPTRKMALEAGYCRFLRDGLWVVGQEETWLEERCGWRGRREDRRRRREEGRNSQLDAKVQEGGDAFALFGRCKREEEEEELVRMARLAKEEEEEAAAQAAGEEAQDNADEEKKDDSDPSNAKNTKSPKKRKRTLKKKLTEAMLIMQWDALSEEEKGRWEELAREEAQSSGKMTGDAEEKKEDEQALTSLDALPDAIIKARDALAEAKEVKRAVLISPSPVSLAVTEEETAEVGKGNSSGTNKAPNEAEASESKGGDATEATKSISSDTTAASGTLQTPERSDSAFDEDDIKPLTSLIKRSPRPLKIAPSHHHRLTPSQISLCLDAVLGHYDAVMRTVRARNLHFELADGFDVLRERGRGRFDMELEQFDGSEFSFLTDPAKAAWMPVVRKILGDDALLVHKGAFLSLPGSDIQVYHQDGVHLTTKRQLPCHAINVFIPLVDLTRHNGPTEFCLGTHHLGYEGYDRAMIQTPTGPAGVPIIFDYRLGHRGMGNASDGPRPVMYLTYTSAKNEFRDSINFSRKRYRKLGNLVDEPLSRGERAAKRRKDEGEK